MGSRARAPPAGFLAIAWMVDRRSVRARTIRAARALPATCIQAATERGPILLVGRVRLADRSLGAPFSSVHCYYDDASCEEWSDLLGASDLDDGVKEEQACDFFLEDETGKALVRMPRAVVRYTKNPPTRVTDARGIEARDLCSCRSPPLDKRPSRARFWALGAIAASIVRAFNGGWRVLRRPICTLSECQLSWHHRP